jgi:hypothetical protein
MLTTGLHQYRHFDGLHNKIDTNDFYGITRHATLATDINEKQYGYTPLYLVCSICCINAHEAFFRIF